MNEKQMLKMLLISVSIVTITITMIVLLMLNIFSINSAENPYNKTDGVCLIFIFSYAITLYFIPKIDNIVEKIYLKLNEPKNKDIEIKYYRELIEKYSIGAIIKCYGKEIDYKDQLVATLLRLSLTNKIKIYNERIEVINEEGLSPSEKMFIKACKGVLVYSKSEIKSEIDKDNCNDALQTDLFNKNTINKSTTKYYTFGLILWLINWFFDINQIGNGIILLIFIANFILIPFSLFAVRYKTIIYRTEKGKETQYKLIGLRNFLKDYSNISDRKLEEITIWNEYMIYAIIFDLKGKLDSESYNMYMNYIKDFL